MELKTTKKKEGPEVSENQAFSDCEAQQHPGEPVPHGVCEGKLRQTPEGNRVSLPSFHDVIKNRYLLIIHSFVVVFKSRDVKPVVWLCGGNNLTKLALYIAG